MTFKSHIEGRNADVSIYPDRIEWTRKGLFGRADSSVILVRSIQGVTTHKAGLAYTTVKVTAGSSVVAFRVTKRQAADVKDTLTRLMLGDVV
jgi:hypothetical protein